MKEGSKNIIPLEVGRHILNLKDKKLEEIISYIETCLDRAGVTHDGREHEYYWFSVEYAFMDDAEINECVRQIQKAPPPVFTLRHRALVDVYKKRFTR
jgi:hypothetical protein